MPFLLVVYGRQNLGYPVKHVFLFFFFFLFCFVFLQLYYLFLKTNNITKNIGMFQLHQANNYQRNNIKTKNEDYDKNIQSV